MAASPQERMQESVTSMLSGIYKITCTDSGKYYYGSAEDFRTRWNTHKSLLHRNKHDNVHLQRAWNKYGPDAFVFEVDMTCPVEKLLQIEQVYLDIYWGRPECMNIAKDAVAPMTGRQHSEETRRYMSATRTGIHRSLETRRRMSGRPHSSDTRRKISDSLKGHRQSEETRRKISESLTGRHYGPLSKEHRRKLSRAKRAYYRQMRGG